MQPVFNTNAPHYESGRMTVSPDKPEVLDVGHWRFPLRACVSPSKGGTLKVEASVTLGAAQAPDEALWGELRAPIGERETFAVSFPVTAPRLTAAGGQAVAEITG